MTVTLHFAPDVEAELLARATAAGLSIDQYLESLIENTAAPADAPLAPAPMRSIVAGIPVFSAGRAMPADLVQQTLDALRTERLRESLRSTPL